MDPATIAASVIAILSPYAKEAGTELVKTAGEVAVAKAKVLFGWLKEKLSGDPVAASDLNRFEANPKKFSAGLQGTLEVQAKRDPGFAAELQKRVQEIQAEITVFKSSGTRRMSRVWTRIRSLRPEYLCIRKAIAQTG